MKLIMRLWTLSALVLAFLSVSCSGEDDTRKQQLIQQGFSEERAAELSKLQLTDDEVQNLGAAKRGGLDEAVAIDMVKSMHERDLKFTLGVEVPVMVSQGIGSTALKQLVELGAVPRWTDDIRAMKDAKIDDVTIVEIAKVRFKENKEVLSGGMYGMLKSVGMSDAGILTFVRKGGNEQQLQDAALAMRLGKSEQAALQQVGL